MHRLMESDLREANTGARWQTGITKSFVVELSQTTRVERIFKMFKSKCVIENFNIGI